MNRTLVVWFALFSLLVVVSWDQGASNSMMYRGIMTIPHPSTPDDALAALIAGNHRFAASHRNTSTDTVHDAEHRHQLVRGQHPFVAVLCCSDSRVCPEFVFDQAAGSIFEIRNAGNLVDDDVMASFEYAIEHLQVPLLLVLAHKQCGAIDAVHRADGKPLHDHLKAFQVHMSGLTDEIHRTHDDHSPSCLDRLAMLNARYQSERLRQESEPVRNAVELGKVRLIYAVYDLETGMVDIPPQQLHTTIP
jgi:carbonic anhydrase